MEKPERSSYTPLDFLQWRSDRNLILTPKFQRRGVWKTPAKAYLIDTMLRGMPIPPIYLRVTQSAKMDRIVREVVDGQQRIAAVLDFLDGHYKLPKALAEDHGANSFAKLTKEQQAAIKTYSFICEIFQGISDEEILEVFIRVNTYSVPLNDQELRNGSFFGYFRNAAVRLARKHLGFWRESRIFTETSIARMAEVELTSELLILEMAGLQDKKKSIDSYYEDFDEDFPQQKTFVQRFNATIDAIQEAFREKLAESEFRRTPLFYTLFGAVYHRLYGVPKIKLTTHKKPLTAQERTQLIDATIKLGEVLALNRAKKEVPEKFQTFVTSSLRQTDNLQPRQTRLETLYRMAFS